MGGLACSHPPVVSFGAGVAAIGPTLGEEAAYGDEPDSAATVVFGPAAAFAALNGLIKPHVSLDTGVSERGYDTLKQPTTQPEVPWSGGENGLPTKPH